ncbi:helix-turn-helix transcriptional regulator [Nesterenkonia halobia]|uniref:HTH cro/C1-type domain-containing protein n=1 Tax=Nesterenkonia halobia TaxID=37922 RepID=A0ABP6R5Z1_9MICC
MKYSEAIAANVRAEVGRKNLSNLEVASCLGVSRGALSKRMTGMTDWKTGELVLLASILGVKFSQITEGIDDADELNHGGNPSDAGAA